MCILMDKTGLVLSRRVKLSLRVQTLASMQDFHASLGAKSKDELQV